MSETDGGVLGHASQEEARRKDEKPAIITLEEVAKFATELYGLGGIDVAKVKELDSYDDRNYHIPNVTYTHKDGKTETLDVIFKVHNGVESGDQRLIEAHNAVLLHLIAASVPVPEPMLTKSGSLIGHVTLPCIRAPDTTRQHAVRVLRYMQGTIIGQSASESPVLLRQLGQVLGRMDKALETFPQVPPVLSERVFLWDLKQVPALLAFSEHISDPKRRALQQKVIANFQSQVAPRIPTLRKAIIQNDANEQNLVIDATRENLTGILDFGDCLCTCIVFELAICLAYLMLGKDDPIGTAQHIYAGYVQEFELTKEEKEMLHTLVCSRMVQSVTMGAYSYSKDPGNEYLLITAKTGWELLELLDTISPADFLAKMEGGA